MDWTPWFAWYPVKTEEGKWVWLRTVERAWQCGGCSIYGDFWQVYRLPPQDEEYGSYGGTD